ncbi:MAG: GntR family transcriptional regulator, partial [Spirochaetaceae bacterium]
MSNDLSQDQSDSSTLSNKVKNLIWEGIRSGEFAPGEKIPSERELCDRFGVSRITVRSALASLAHKGVLRRRAGSGTFVNENRLRTGTIAFLRCQHGEHTHEIRGDFVYSEVLEGIQSELLESGIHLIFSYIREKGEDSKRLLENLLYKTDGLILGEMRSEEFYQQVLSQHTPFVLINPEFSNYIADTVDYDNLAGAVRATEYMISLGHRKIAFVNGRMPTRHAVERLNGYRLALEKHQISFSPDLVAGETNWQSETGYTAAINLLKRDPAITAIFAANDALAIGAIKGVRQVGFRVPEDVSVLGFDDMIIAMHSEPALTTMRVDRHAMGRT